MLKIGLTGGIGAGKSAAAQAFEALGALIIDSDKIAREVVEPGTPGLAALVEAFGSEIVSSDGTLDRPQLAAKVFGDDQARATLNSITHPLVAARGQELMDSAPTEQIIVRDVPLIVELGLSPFFHLVIVVDAPLEERLRRLTQVRGMSREDALARIQAQAQDEQRRAAADIWLTNNTTQEDLRGAAAELWQSRLLPFNEGLLRNEVTAAQYDIVSYDPSWPQQAERLTRRIAAAAGSAAERVEHVGPTTRRDTPSRDVLDFQLIRNTSHTELDLTKSLVAAGFVPTAWSESPDVKDVNDESSLHEKPQYVSADPVRPAQLHVKVSESVKTL